MPVSPNCLHELSEHLRGLTDTEPNDTLDHRGAPLGGGLDTLRALRDFAQPTSFALARAAELDSQDTGRIADALLRSCRWGSAGLACTLYSAISTIRSGARRIDGSS